MQIKFPPRTEDELVASLKRYFELHLDGELGDLPARNLLRYIAEEIGPTLYNLAVRDVQEHLQRRVADLDVDCHADELPYWRKRKST